MMFMNPYGFAWLVGMALFSGFLLGYAAEPSPVSKGRPVPHLRLVSNNC